MRILIASFLILSIGAIVVFGQVLNNRTPTSPELAQLKSNCLQCHDTLPVYSNITAVHNRHAALECSVCHDRNNSLSAVGNSNRILSWIGVGAIALGLVAVTVNFIIMKTRKGQVEKQNGKTND